MDGFRYVSENTIDHLSLHDCDCSAMKSDGEDLIFEVEWIEVLATHPDNPFPQAHQSGVASLTLPMRRSWRKKRNRGGYLCGLTDSGFL